VSALVAYRDAVVDALMAAGIGVRDNEADESGPLIGIDLDPLDAYRTPTLVWTPAAGWRIGISDGLAVDPESIRYVGLEAVPLPAHVAGIVGVWLDNPGRVRRDEPVFGSMPRGALAERLTWRAGGRS
jgi:glyoxylase-like metal-dependent hydrolase (beta-lactamase superfamily II)